MSLTITFRPLQRWPEPTLGPMRPSPFSAFYSDTVMLLKRELGFLDVELAVIELACEEDALRQRDSLPKADAKMRHPGVVLSFESRVGALRYATAAFNTWQANLRAIALGLEALRRVDRYGITRGGEQYRGWRQIESGGASVDRGRELVRQHGGVRDALFVTHPDRGGDADDFQSVRAYQGWAAKT